MFYILDSSGFIEEVSTHYIERDNKTCTEYTGAVPSGYDSLDDWVLNANIRTYKIVSGNLTYDANRDAALTEQWAQWANMDGYGAVLGKASKNFFNGNNYSFVNDYNSGVDSISIHKAVIKSYGSWARTKATITGLKPNTNYVISAQLDKSNLSGETLSGFYNDISWQSTGMLGNEHKTGKISYKFTSDNEGKCIIDFYTNWTGNAITGSVIYSNIQLEEGSIATEFEEYFEPHIVVLDSNGGCHKIYLT